MVCILWMKWLSVLFLIVIHLVLSNAHYRECSSFFFPVCHKNMLDSNMHVIHLFIYFHQLAISMQCTFRYYSEIAFAYFFQIFCSEIGFTLSDNFRGFWYKFAFGMNLPVGVCMSLSEPVHVHCPSWPFGPFYQKRMLKSNKDPTHFSETRHFIQKPPKLSVMHPEEISDPKFRKKSINLEIWKKILHSNTISAHMRGSGV